MSCLIIVLPLIFTAGCSNLPTDFTNSRELWQEKNIVDYFYVIVMPHFSEIAVTVHNKTGVSTIPYMKTPYFLGDISSINPIFTVEYLFEKVEKYLRDKDRIVTVKYDPEYGFPTNLKAESKSLPIFDAFIISDFIPEPLRGTTTAQRFQLIFCA